MKWVQTYLGVLSKARGRQAEVQIRCRSIITVIVTALEVSGMAQRKPRKPTHEVVVLRAKAPQSTNGVPKSCVGELCSSIESDYEPCVGETYTSMKAVDSDYEETEPTKEEIYTPMKTGSSIESDYEPCAGETYTSMKAVDSDYEETEPTKEEIYTPMKTGSSEESDYELYVGEIHTALKTASTGDRDSTPPLEHSTKPGHQRLFPMAVQNNYTPQARKPQQEIKPQQMIKPQQTRKPQHETRKPQHETRKPQHETRKPQHVTRKLQQSKKTQQAMMIKPPNVEREDAPEDDYELVSVYENVCDFVEETKTKKKVARPKPKPRAVCGNKTERQGGQRRQRTHEIVVLPANPIHTTPQAEDDNYTPLKTIRHTPDKYETTQLHYEEDEDEYENVEIPT